MSRTATLKPDSRGQYCRNLGKLPHGGQPKFVLGRDQREAILRNARLEKLWELWLALAATEDCELIHEPTRTENCPLPGLWAQFVEHRGFPVWEASFRSSWPEPVLRLGRAIAAGKAILLGTKGVLEIGSPLELAEALATGCLTADTVDGMSPWIERGRAVIEQERSKAQGIVEFLSERLDVPLPRQRAGMTVKQAIERFREAMREEFTEGGKLTQAAGTMFRHLDFVARHIIDVDLADFGTEEIEVFIRTIRKRPPAMTHRKKGEQPISAVYAKQLLKTVRRLVRWMHRARSIPWRRPDDYEVLPVKINRSAEEKAQTRPDQVQTYTLDELRTLWKYATPLDRLLMVLALNCGFGRKEVATLRRDELRLRQRHPAYRELNLMPDEGDSWVMRIRQKSDVYGEWRLWPITVHALDWYLPRRPESDLPDLILAESGKPLHEPTTGGNEKSAVANRWWRLRERIRKDTPDFPSHSFNKLRKTGASLMRLEGGGEVAGMYLSHGDPARSADNLLEVYANKPWAKLHTCIALLGEKLRDVWMSVADPFPESADGARRRGGPNISRAKIEKVKELAAQRWKTGKIAREVGVSRETVRRWMKREL